MHNETKNVQTRRLQTVHYIHGLYITRENCLTKVSDGAAYECHLSEAYREFISPAAEEWSRRRLQSSGQSPLHRASSNSLHVNTRDVRRLKRYPYPRDRSPIRATPPRRSPSHR